MMCSVTTIQQQSESAGGIGGFNNNIILRGVISRDGSVNSIRVLFILSCILIQHIQLVQVTSLYSTTNINRQEDGIQLQSDNDNVHIAVQMNVDDVDEHATKRTYDYADSNYYIVNSKLALTDSIDQKRSLNANMESTTGLIAHENSEGYYLDTLMDILPGHSNGPGTKGELGVLNCPSDNVIKTKYKCKLNEEWVDCTRKHCCNDYTFIAGRCVHKQTDPCTLNLCEQKCTVYLQRVICTCYEGYKFNPENQKNGVRPFCVDVNECNDSNGDCEHTCVNEVGKYHCKCNAGYHLGSDNHTCEHENDPAMITNSPTSNQDLDTSAEDGSTAVLFDAQPAKRDRCFANCGTVMRLHDKLKTLQEKVREISTAIRLSTYASGPPGPAGPPGPPGPPGLRGFPGHDGGPSSIEHPEDFTYSIMDTFVPLEGEKTPYCRCERGPIGPPGATGAMGPKGETGNRGVRGMKGEQGNFDYLLLLLADMRHDIVHLQRKVYENGERPPAFDLKTALNNHRIKEKHRFMRQHRLLHAYAAPPVVEEQVDNNQSLITEFKRTVVEQTTENLEHFYNEYLDENIDSTTEISYEDEY